ncbi:hypothetical protein EV203_103116 [Caldanaerobacter subterraneus]|uniref:Uncharacterized protein n=2 Tax=Caldanaerobacter subterraneus TaxID=911092 RepID=A0A4R2KDB5_9THEO|nr:hypothetical protein EV203_103116 [Caldanaerobacter subterraneus]
MMNKLIFKKGYTRTVWGGEAPAYYVMDQNVAIAVVYSWEAFYPKKYRNVFLKMFNKKGDLNYIVFLTRFGKCFEASALKEVRNWFNENWDSENFKFKNEEELESKLLVFPGIPEVKLKNKNSIILKNKLNV